MTLLHVAGHLCHPGERPDRLQVGRADAGIAAERDLSDQQRIAGLGADVIRQAGVLDDVAELVRCQNWPARGRQPGPPLGSMIIRAANAFDDMVGSSTDRERSAAAVERMRLDPAEYDGIVVAALAGVASRRVPSRL